MTEQSGEFAGLGVPVAGALRDRAGHGPGARGGAPGGALIGGVTRAQSGIRYTV